jgi:hypothetical protein
LTALSFNPIFFLVAAKSRVARFFLLQHTKIYQITIKYTKWPQHIPSGRKIDQMDIKFTNIFHCKTIKNLPKIGIFGLKIWHLATLAKSPTSDLHMKPRRKGFSHFLKCAFSPRKQVFLSECLLSEWLFSESILFECAQFEEDRTFPENSFFSG